MENPDVVLEIDWDDMGPRLIQFKVYNREPDNYPTVEFMEALYILFGPKERNSDRDQKET